MNRKYETPEVEVEKFNEESVVVTSGIDQDTGEI